MSTGQGTRWSVQVGEETTSALWERAEGATGGSVLVLGHGASTNMEHRTLENLAATFLANGLSVVRFNFLYMEKKTCLPLSRCTGCKAQTTAFTSRNVLAARRRTSCKRSERSAGSGPRRSLQRQT